MRPSEIVPFLRKMVAARMPVMLVGPPGVGKSEIVEQIASEEGAHGQPKYDLIISHPVTADPTDAKGLPWPAHDGKQARFLPFGDLARALKAERPTIWFLDDLGQASPAVQASFMQLILARKVNDHSLPDHVTFVAASNRREDRAGVSGILEPVKSRFAAIVNMDVNLDDWVDWAFGNEIPPEIIAYLRYRPDQLCNFQASADMSQSPLPRTWAYAAKILGLGLSSEIQHKALIGAIGEGAAAEFTGYLRIYRQLPDIEKILRDPENGEIPSDANALYAIATALGAKASPKNIDKIGVYAKRLLAEHKGEFAALTLRDAVRRDPAIYHTSAFVEIITGDLEDLIKGEGFVGAEGN